MDITRLTVMVRDGWTCQRCGAPAECLAHRIAQTKTWLKKYGPEVIHHPDNLVAVCRNLACNSSFNIGNKPVQREELVSKIRAELEYTEVLF